MAFVSFVSKTSALVDNLDGGDGQPRKKAKKVRNQNKECDDSKNLWKCEAPKKGESKTKEVKNKTYYYCAKATRNVNINVLLVTTRKIQN